MAPDRFTGERPGRGAEFAYDEARHLVAYRYALDLVRGKDVLDAGCGDGFGTQMLAAVARSVVGIDYDAEAIAGCERAWHEPNLAFRRVDLTAPGDFHARFDVVLSFQVVEHIDDPTPFLAALRARLAATGVLVLTTPNRLTSFSENPYHVREYAPEELQAVLAPFFPSVTLLGVHGNAKVQEFDANRRRTVERILRLDPLGVRRLLPRAVVTHAFARLAVLVRRHVRRATAAPPITPDDFVVRADAVERSMDLIALCSVVAD